MRYFWRTAVLRVKACEISLAASRALACRDVQTLINHPVVGRYVKDLQLSAGMVRAVCVPSVCVLLFLFDNALDHVKLSGHGVNTNLRLVEGPSLLACCMLCCN